MSCVMNTERNKERFEAYYKERAKEMKFPNEIKSDVDRKKEFIGLLEGILEKYDKMMSFGRLRIPKIPDEVLLNPLWNIHVGTTKTFIEIYKIKKPGETYVHFLKNEQNEQNEQNNATNEDVNEFIVKDLAKSHLQRETILCVYDE